jgi:hypothetical protein
MSFIDFYDGEEPISKIEVERGCVAVMEEE